ncbi:hypothetical protein FC73_GL001209 [Fructilactobacillus fructivorans]|nr:hypothetical protein FC73_GL001209 [Fructilactobacillus fructivorans]
MDGGILMNNQDPDSRYERYDFNATNDQRHQKKTFKAWPWVLGLVVIVILLVFGIHLLTSGNGLKQLSVPSTSQQSSKAIRSEKKAKNFNKAEQSTNQSASSVSQNQASTSQNRSQASNANNSNENNSADDSNSMFATPKTFDSVQDAKNYARATQKSWLAAGYSNFTIERNGQGFYTLQFVR